MRREGKAPTKLVINLATPLTAQIIHKMNPIGVIPKNMYKALFTFVEGLTRM